ncbi:MAG: hypothetical protein J6C84_08880 [Lachnospiraceae bacterium]|nr:hypothetical protein [Lachnospiraceae bacterium]
MLFMNSFLSYLMLLLVIVLVAGLAVFIGISLRRKKNASEQEEVTAAEKSAN